MELFCLIGIISVSRNDNINFVNEKTALTEVT